MIINGMTLATLSVQKYLCISTVIVIILSPCQTKRIAFKKKNHRKSNQVVATYKSCSLVLASHPFTHRTLMWCDCCMCIFRLFQVHGCIFEQRCLLRSAMVRRNPTSPSPTKLTIRTTTTVDDDDNKYAADRGCL